MSTFLSTQSFLISSPAKRLAALGLTVLLAACGRPGGEGGTAKGGEGEEKKEVKPVPVEVAAASRRAIAASYTSTAALEAPNEAMVVSKTSGVLLQLHAEEGDQVKAGQLMARIDPERARLEVARSEAALRKLEADYARSRELFDRKLVAADAHERLRFDVATQRAAFNLAQLELSYTDVVAPIDGVVAQRTVKQGNLINVNQSMFRIVDMARLEAVLNVPERELATLRVGLPVQLAVDALPGISIAGEIIRISPVVDAATGTFRATASFSDAEGRLKPGMFGRLAVVYEQRSDALTVPRLALVEEGDETTVFALRGGVVEKRRLVLGYVNGDFAEVRSGLEEGERVVTAGKVAVRDGSKVEVIGDPPAVAESPEEASPKMAGPAGQ